MGVTSEIIRGLVSLICRTAIVGWTVYVFVIFTWSKQHLVAVAARAGLDLAFAEHSAMLVAALAWGVPVAALAALALLTRPPSS